MEEGDLGFVFRFRKAISLGTPEEIDKIGLSAYQQAMEQSNYEAAARLAKEVYGNESVEYMDAVEKAKKQRESPERAAEHGAVLKPTTPEEANEMTRQRRRDFGLEESRELTPEEAEEFEISIGRLLDDLDQYDFGSGSPERQEEWYWVEQEASVGIDRELANAVLQRFLKILQEEGNKSDK